MSTPQQPDLARSGRSAAEPKSAKAHADLPPGETGPAGPVPEDNLPGHHPEVEQDKPIGPPPRPTRAASKAAERKGAAEQAVEEPGPVQRAVRDTVGSASFAFAFEPRLVPLALAFGVTPTTAAVELTADELRVRFGLWRLITPVDNIVDVEVTGPYRWLAVAGPPRLSLVDSGITFATTTAGGVCISFAEAVPAALPVPLLRHRAATVTVRDPDALATVLRQRIAER